MKKFNVFSVVGMAMVILSAVALSFTAIQQPIKAQQQLQQNEQPQVQQIQNDSTAILRSESHALNTIFKQVENSVIQVTRTVPGTNVTGLPTGNLTALGSGFVYDKLGHVITNNHVVGGAKVVDVTFIDGNRYTANVTGADPYSDIAVLRIIEKIPSKQALNPLVLGNSSKLVVGDQVIAIGNPFGLDGTMTAGIVSQTGRLLPAPNVGYSIPDLIQTDAAINPGNSGGPLLNIQGEVVGINFAGLQGGVGFAVPSNTVMRIAPVLIEKGNYTHPSLGFAGATLTSDLAKSVQGLPANIKGIFVSTILKGGPADRAGLHGTTIDQFTQRHGGDVIIAADGRNVTRFEDLVSYIEEKKAPGEAVVLTVIRDGHSLDLKAILQARPSGPPPYLKQPPVPPIP
jgi:S1-C subfamily serine protease